MKSTGLCHILEHTSTDYLSERRALWSLADDETFNLILVAISHGRNKYLSGTGAILKLSSFVQSMLDWMMWDSEVVKARFDLAIK